jgi:single-strand DNA-binding protein
MAKSVNKVLLLGYAGKDPEIRTLASGTVVASLSLATTERIKDNHGEWKERTEWHFLTAYQRRAEVIRDYVRKGSRLFLEGKLETHSWDDANSGQKRYRTDVVVVDLTLLSSSDQSGRGHSRTPASDGSSDGEYAEMGISDQEIPF